MQISKNYVFLDVKKHDIHKILFIMPTFHENELPNSTFLITKLEISVIQTTVVHSIVHLLS